MSGAGCWVQVDFNKDVYSLLGNIIPSSGSARWVQGDSVAGPRQEFPEQVSLLLTSPPYLDVEVYTTKDDPEGVKAADLSRQPVAEFRKRYKSMLCLWGALVKDGGWAVFRVGDVSTKEVSGSLLAAQLHSADCWLETGTQEGMFLMANETVNALSADFYCHCLISLSVR